MYNISTQMNVTIKETGLPGQMEDGDSSFTLVPQDNVGNGCISSINMSRIMTLNLTFIVDEDIWKNVQYIFCTAVMNDDQNTTYNSKRVVLIHETIDPITNSTTSQNPTTGSVTFSGLNVTTSSNKFTLTSSNPELLLFLCIIQMLICCVF